MELITNTINLHSSTKTINGVWKVLLTDSSLNKFSQESILVSKYLMTEITSPYGKNSVFYNTIPHNNYGETSVFLNFSDIGDGNISDILIRASKAFFAKWEISFINHTSNEVTPIDFDIDLKIEPAIAFNKFFGIGFIPDNSHSSETPFELKLRLK